MVENTSCCIHASHTLDANLTGDFMYRHFSEVGPKRGLAKVFAIFTRLDLAFGADFLLVKLSNNIS